MAPYGLPARRSGRSKEHPVALLARWKPALAFATGSHFDRKHA